MQPVDTSKRDLTEAEMEVLRQISALVKQIVEDSSVKALAAAGPLRIGYDPAAGRFPEDQSAIFLRRFGDLPGRLGQLTPQPGYFGLRNSKIRVDGRLPAGHAAKTDVQGTDDSATVVWLAPAALLPGQTAEALRNTALAVIHELTHALEPENGFPVKDYAYQDSWAYGWLPPEFVTGNADSYRHLARLVSEQQGKDFRLYAPNGPVPAQRQALRVLGAAKLSSALALANVVLDRAWVRALDLPGFVSQGAGGLNWHEPENQAYAKDNSAALQRIEEWLCGKKIIGERGRRLAYVLALGETDQAVIEQIQPFLNEIKRRTGGMALVLSAGGGFSYDKEKKRLTIPYGFRDLDVEALARQILGAVAPLRINQGGVIQAALDALVAQAGELIFKLAEWDRLDLQKPVRDLCGRLAQGPFPRPADADLATLNTELALIVLESRATDWKRVHREKQVKLNAAGNDKNDLTDRYALACHTLEHLDTLPGLTPVQKARRQDAVSQIVESVRLIEALDQERIVRPAAGPLA